MTTLGKSHEIPSVVRLSIPLGAAVGSTLGLVGGSVLGGGTGVPSWDWHIKDVVNSS